jgi:PAS domain S-box-containing protein
MKIGVVIMTTEIGALNPDVEQAWRSSIDEIMSTIGIEFFHSLVKHLARALGANCVYIAELTPAPRSRFRTLGVYLDGEHSQDFEFDRAGTAASEVMEGSMRACPRSVQTLFPSDPALKRMKAEGFIGVPLISSQGGALGLIAIIYREPLADGAQPEFMLGPLMTRAAAELERKQSEEAVHESEQRYRAFVATSTDAMLRVEYAEPIDTAASEGEQIENIYRYGYIAECNQAAADMLGVPSPKEAIGKRVEILASRSHPRSIELLRSLIRAGYRGRMEVIRTDKAGNVSHRLRHQWGIIEDGKLKRFWLVTRDITDIKRAEEALLASERRMRDLLEGVHLLALVLDTDGKITLCNDPLLRLTGWTRDELIGKDWFLTMVSDRERDKSRARFLSALSGGAARFRVQVPIVTKSGSRLLTSWDCMLQRGPGGELTGLASIGRDVTEEKAIEAHLRQTQKLESTGRLAGAIAHDFNNLVTVIQGYTELLLNKPNLDEEMGAALTVIRKSCEAPRLMNLNAFIVENEPMLRLVAGKQINIVTDIDPELAMVSVDPGQLQQVLLNLTLNARDAMDMQGKLTIRTQNVEVDAESARMTDVRPGTYVQLEIIDTGGGMTEEVRSRLFEPFFTTKPPGKGTGLGLSTVYGIIKQSGGAFRWKALQAREPPFGSCYLSPKSRIPVSNPATPRAAG